MNHTRIFLPLLLLSCFVSNASAKVNTIFQKIQAYEELTLTTNLDSLVLNKRKATYQPARMVLRSDQSPTLEMDISIRARGKFRRRICELPPIKLNFAKADLKQMGLLKKYDKLKLVTHCQSGKNFDQYLLKEYWAYQMYNVVTEDSYRVKLLKIKYIHEEDSSRFIESYAFILENPEELAERIGGTLVPQKYGLTTAEITTNSFEQTVFFNYMIGNTDWAVLVQRNLTLVQKNGEKGYTVIPYDFDQSKLVNAPYMCRNSDIKEIKACNRHAMGVISTESALKQLSGTFKKYKTDFKEYRNCSFLKRKIKGEMTSYLYSFYMELGDKSGMKEEFLALH